jgi:para-aminobenzoate synthetase component I
MKWNKKEISLFKEKALQWASQFEVSLLLDNNFSINACGLHDIEFMLAAGVKRELKCNVGNAFDELKKFQSISEKTIFGLFSYDLKNEIEQLNSIHSTGIEFPDLYFFEPIFFLSIDKNGNVFGDEKLIDEIQLTIPNSIKKNVSINLTERVHRDTYLKNVAHIRQHIIEGDVYELNYCVEFFAEGATIDPAYVYSRLIEKSPTPFSSFFKCYDQILICASPERFLKNQLNKLFSQPIKGTIKRGQSTIEDEQLKNDLLNSEKERAENLMIVDLVRNDLARSSLTGSVNVDELFGIYSFEHVHQMISTVSSTKKENIHFVDAIKNAFPMGSMTGAPKISAMQLIEKYELTKRGLYSGAIGYIMPNGDFDLNVVIRSLQYNQSKKYLSYEVGSAITFDSDAEQEYEECILKAKAMIDVLGNAN